MAIQATQPNDLLPLASMAHNLNQYYLPLRWLHTFIQVLAHKVLYLLEDD